MRAVMVAAGLMLTTPNLALAQDTPAAASPAAARDARLAALIADYDAYLRANDPVAAGNDGDRAALSRLPDTSRAFELAQRAPLQGFLTRAEAIPADSLSQADRIDRDFIVSLLTRRLEGVELDTGRLAFNSEGGPGTWAVYLGSGARLRSEADAEAWIARLSALGGVYDNALEAARRGLTTGLTQPRSVVESAIVQAQADTAITPETDPLLRPFDAANLPEARKQALRARAAAAVAQHVTPRRQAWLAFLTDEVVDITGWLGGYNFQWAWSSGWAAGQAC